MPDLPVTRALPNPVGKDLLGGWATNEQLNGEWVEFHNVSQRLLSLEGVAILHYTFSRNCEKTGEERLRPSVANLEPRTPYACTREPAQLGPKERFTTSTSATGTMPGTMRAGTR